jgi:hypothetical protein
MKAMRVCLEQVLDLASEFCHSHSKEYLVPGRRVNGARGVAPSLYHLCGGLEPFSVFIRFLWDSL